MTLSELRGRLEQGLAGHLLEELAKSVIQGPADELSGPRVILSFVARELASVWEGPVTLAEASEITRRFGSPLKKALLAIESKNESEALRSTEELARVYLTWRSED